jgi:drug/metabolite transporter (DMT)-like permease
LYPLRIILLTCLVMIAFAGNSLLCRAALKETAIDPATFTSVRLLSGALMLWFLLHLQRCEWRETGSWGSALALFAYAALLSYSYGGLSTAMGALLLFGAVQATMIIVGLFRGEHPDGWQWLGMSIAFAGLVGLMLPGLSAPPLLSSLLMLGSGIAWGVYTLRGKGASDPTVVTAGNFIRTVPMTLGLSLLMFQSARFDTLGVSYALVSGAITSGLGYALWYRVVPQLNATTAATVQLSVPLIAALGGVLLLSESLSMRLLLAGAAIIGGIALVSTSKARRAP